VNFLPEHICNILFAHVILYFLYSKFLKCHFLHIVHHLIATKQVGWQIIVFLSLFIYSLFNDAFSISNYTASNERMRMIVNNELERMWKEAVVA
jgi:hypothetical protein